MRDSFHHDRIRELREARRLTQKEMSQILNCTQACYSHYECGQRSIPTKILIQLADFHNTSIDYLLGCTNNPAPYPDIPDLADLEE